VYWVPERSAGTAWKLFAARRTPAPFTGSSGRGERPFSYGRQAGPARRRTWGSKLLRAGVFQVPNADLCWSRAGEVDRREKENGEATMRTLRPPPAWPKPGPAVPENDWTDLGANLDEDGGQRADGRAGKFAQLRGPKYGWKLHCCQAAGNPVESPPAAKNEGATPRPAQNDVPEDCGFRSLGLAPHPSGVERLRRQGKKSPET